MATTRAFSLSAAAGLRRLLLATSLRAILAVSVPGCKSKDLNDPEYLSERLVAGDEQAFRHVRRLEDPEQRVAAIPALIDAFNAGVHQEDVLRLLLDIGHPDAIPAFEAALDLDDSRLAGLGARGLGDVGSGEHVTPIANRLRRVRDPAHYEPFLEALRKLPGRPDVAPVLVEILSRPVGRIGGINTVRYGCEILGKSGNTEPATIDALLFSYVNFVPQPFQDARLECQLALVRMGDAAVGPLFEMFLQQNQTVADHLRSLRYEPVVGSLRAAWALSDGASLAIRDRMIEWFRTDHPIDAAYLSGLPIEERQVWFQNYGQMFEQAATYLGNVGAPGPEDPVHQLLREMLVRGELPPEIAPPNEDRTPAVSPLENFAQFMNTSDGAELGLRATVLNALVNIGDATNRDAVFQLAMAGDLRRGGDIWLRQEAAHAFALLSQPGDAERYQELINAIDNPTLRENVEPYRIMLQVADECAHEVACLSNYLTHEDLWAREKAAHDLAHYAENQAAAAGALLSQMTHPDIGTRLIYVHALRELPLPQTGAEQLSAALEANREAAYRDVEQELLILRYLKLGE